MNKTLPLAMIALAAIALTAVPTASACYYYGVAGETVRYATPCGGFGVRDDAQSVVEFVIEETGRVVDFTIDLVTGIPLPV